MSPNDLEFLNIGHIPIYGRRHYINITNFSYLESVLLLAASFQCCMCFTVDMEDVFHKDIVLFYQAVAVESAEMGVTVNAVCPGPMDNGC